MALRTVQAGLTLAITAGLWLPAAVDAHRGGLHVARCHLQGGSYNSVVRCPRKSQSATDAPQRWVSGTVAIHSCFDGDTCLTSKGEKIRLACIDAPA